MQQTGRPEGRTAGPRRNYLLLLTSWTVIAFRGEEEGGVRHGRDSCVHVGLRPWANMKRAVDCGFQSSREDSGHYSRVQ